MPVTRSSAPIIRSGFPRAGSPSGIQKRREFIAQITAICGDVPLLWTPSGFTMPATSADRNARTFTNTGTFTLSALGSGVSVAFPGANHVTVPDAANLSFGNGTNDAPFSIVFVGKQNATATDKTIYARYDLTTGVTKREFRFFLDDGERLSLFLYDESTGARIGRRYNTALATGSNLLLVATYDGSATAAGIKLYSAAVQIDDTNDNSLSYTAMEDTAALSYIGASEGTDGAGTSFLDGAGSLLLVCAGVLDLNEQWDIKTVVNGFYGLEL